MKDGGRRRVWIGPKFRSCRGHRVEAETGGLLGEAQELVARLLPDFDLGLLAWPETNK